MEVSSRCGRFFPSAAPLTSLSFPRTRRMTMSRRRPRLRVGQVSRRFFSLLALLTGLLSRASFAHAFHDYIGDARLAPNAGGVPDPFAVALGGVAPSGTPTLQAPLDRLLALPEQDWNLLP